MRKSIRILEKVKKIDEVPYVLVAHFAKEDDEYTSTRTGDVEMRISGLSGFFRLTPKDQERLGHFLLKEDGKPMKKKKVAIK